LYATTDTPLTGSPVWLVTKPLTSAMSAAIVGGGDVALIASFAGFNSINPMLSSLQFWH
jgi:hypothetical protein